MKFYCQSISFGKYQHFKSIGHYFDSIHFGHPNMKKPKIKIQVIIEESTPEDIYFMCDIDFKDFKDESKHVPGIYYGNKCFTFLVPSIYAGKKMFLSKFEAKECRKEIIEKNQILIPTVGQMFKTENKGECSICVSKIKKGLFLTPCGHPFHHKCIKEWMRKNHQFSFNIFNGYIYNKAYLNCFCPICRKMFV